MSSKHTLIAAQQIRPYRAERIAADPRTRKAAAADRRARRNAKRLENARRQQEGMER